MEEKFIDSWVPPNSLSSGQTLPELLAIDSAAGVGVDHCTPIAQGNGPSDRIGRNAWVKRLHVKGNVTVNFGPNKSVINVPMVTIFMVLDKQANAAVPDKNAIWVNPGSAEPQGGYPFINLEYKDRFQVLCTRHLSFNECPTTTGAVAGEYYFPKQHKRFEMYKLWKDGMKQQFESPTGGINGVTNWAITLWAHAVCDTDGDAIVSANVRGRFTG